MVVAELANTLCLYNRWAMWLGIVRKVSGESELAQIDSCAAQEDFASPALKNRFPASETPIPASEIRLHASETDLHASEIKSPASETDFHASETLFPTSDVRFHASETHFHASEFRFPRSENHFPIFDLAHPTSAIRVRSTEKAELGPGNDWRRGATESDVGRAAVWVQADRDRFDERGVP